jgi:hypothetical protein
VEGEHVELTPWEEGRVIARRYTLERKLGGGAMGEVWLAEDVLLRKQVALKVLQAELAQKRDTVRRFLREVALAHSVTHPHVVRIYDTGEEDGLPFFTMEFLQGKTLEELLAGNGELPGERLEFPEIRRIALQVLDAMAAAHRVGVVHRDLKPGNVMLTHRGAIVMDFGVAGIEEAPAGVPAADSVRALVNTEAGTIFGSPAYMSPELWEGESASVQSDLYAFGVMLYQMLTGRLPYRAKTPAGYLQQLSAGRAPPLRSLRPNTPWGLVRLIRHCMAPKRQDRPLSAEAAANLAAPLRGKNWRIVLGGLAGVGATAAALMIYDARQSYVARGLPDAAAEMDLSAAVRSYDVGDTEAALRQLDRLSRRAPQSASVAFWRATMLHELGDEAARQRVCEADGERRGGDVWRSLADGACADSYLVAEPALRELEAPGSTRVPELLPIAIRWDLLPRVETATEDEGPARTQARALLDVLGDAPDTGPHWDLAARRQLARVDIEIALGRIDEAANRLTALTDEHPEVPIYARRAAWLSARLGSDDRARALAKRIRPVDPHAWSLLLMADGRMKEAWGTVEAYEGTPTGEGLRRAWCGFAVRFEMTPTPPPCQALSPSIAAALSGGERDGGALLEGTILDAIEAVAAGRCAGGPAPSVLTHAASPFEVRRAELELEGALVGCDGQAPDLALAQELGSRISAVAQTDPWVLLLLARLDEARGEQRPAHARRLAAIERWRHADPDLPVVAELRRAMHPSGEGPRTAALP